MSDYDNAIFRLATEQEAEPEDFTGEDGLLYCGKCRQPKEAYFAEGKTLFGRDRHPKECDCQRADREALEAADREHKHREEVECLKRKGFTDPAMREWTFENDNGKCPQMHNAYSYVKRWEQIKEENHSLILWGNVGTGKSYTSFEELTPTLLREFVEKIVVHESEALDGKRRGKLRRQEIEIYYSFVGKVELPD